MKELQQIMSEWLKDRPVMYRHNDFHNVVDLLRGEVDELVDAHPNGDNQEIEQEVADVFIFALTFANILGVDAETAVREKIAYNNTRYVASEFQVGDYDEARARCRGWVKETDWKKTFGSI